MARFSASAEADSSNQKDTTSIESLMIRDSDVPPERRVVLRARLAEAAKMLIPFAGIFLAYLAHVLVPNVYPATYVPKYWAPFLLGCACVWAVVWLLGLFIVPVRKRALRLSWLLAFLFVFLEVWDIATLKTGYMKPRARFGVASRVREDVRLEPCGIGGGDRAGCLVPYDAHVVECH